MQRRHRSRPEGGQLSLRATRSADLGEGRGGEGDGGVRGESGRLNVAEGGTICPEGGEGRKVDGRVRLRGGAAAC